MFQVLSVCNLLLKGLSQKFNVASKGNSGSFSDGTPTPLKGNRQFVEILTHVFVNPARPPLQ